MTRFKYFRQLRENFYYCIEFRSICLVQASAWNDDKDQCRILGNDVSCGRKARSIKITLKPYIEAQGSPAQNSKEMHQFDSSKTYKSEKYSGRKYAILKITIAV